MFFFFLALFNWMIESANERYSGSFSRSDWLKPYQAKGNLENNHNKEKCKIN